MNQKFSIKQACLELKISRQTLYKHLGKLKIKTFKEKNRSYLTKKDLEEIKPLIITVKPDSKVYNEEEKPNKNKGKDTVSDILNILTEQLKEKDKQIEKKDVQLETLQQSLNQQQQLSAHDKKIIDQLSQKVQLLEAPQEEKKVEEVENTSGSSSGIISGIIRILITLGILGSIGWMLLRNGIF